MMSPDDENLQEPAPPDIYSLAVVLEGGMAIAAGVIGWWIGVPPLETIARDGASGSDHVWAVAWGAGATVPMLVAMFIIDRYPIGPLRELQRTVDQVVTPLFRSLTLFQLAMISILAGIGEEMLFRGLLQTGLIEWTQSMQGGVWVALAGASLAFGLCHSLSTTYFVVTTLIGLYLGALFLWTDNLLAPIVTHALYDFVALIYLVRRRNGRIASCRDAGSN
jgi:membrane protease YdiL (CAAX protease family)